MVQQIIQKDTQGSYSYESSNKGQGELVGPCLGRGVAVGMMTTAAVYSLEVVDASI